MPARLAKLTGPTLDSLLPSLRLAAAPTAALRGASDAVEAFERLERGGFLLEAATFVAYALPSREAVWWACLCADHTRPADLPPPDRLAREAAEAWVRQPTEEMRTRAMQHAQAARCQTPEAWAAVAAFWSGNADTPPDPKEASPSRDLRGLAVIGAVRLAAVRRNPRRQTTRLRRFLASGRAIAEGRDGRLPSE